MTNPEANLGNSSSHAPAVSAYVLAGGASTRFGSDKALAKIAGRTLLYETCQLIFDTVTKNVSIVGAASKYGSHGARCIEDRWPGAGPLGGVITALLDSREKNPLSEWNLIVGCDMPFLTEEILVYCVDRANKSRAEVVLPRSSKGLEPMCACWRTSSAIALQQVFNKGVRKMTDAMQDLRMEVLEENDWKKFYHAERLFWNMNTREEYEEAARILEGENR